jgi:phage FluMu protein Com
MLSIFAQISIAESLFGLVALAAGCALAIAAARRLRGPGPLPKHGPISCDHCSGLVARDVSYLGQTLTCPRCGSQITVPGECPTRWNVSAKSGVAFGLGITVLWLTAHWL